MDYEITLRITRNWTKEYTQEKLLEVLGTPLKKILHPLHILTAFEISKELVQHTHSYIITKLHPDTVRKRLNTLALKGNKDFSVSLVKNQTSMLSYTLKCGDYISTPDFPLDLNNIPKWQFKQLDFDERVKKLNLEYVNSDLSDLEYLYRLLTIYSEHNKKIYIGNIRAGWLSLANTRNSKFDIPDYNYRDLQEMNVRQRIAYNIASIRI